jgi:hypothetical protein
MKMEEVRARFPFPSSSDGDHATNDEYFDRMGGQRYCVGGALCLSMRHQVRLAQLHGEVGSLGAYEDINFPEPMYLARVLASAAVQHREQLLDGRLNEGHGRPARRVGADLAEVRRFAGLSGRRSA